jgi:hypothetical protein
MTDSGPGRPLTPGGFAVAHETQPGSSRVLENKLGTGHVLQFGRTGSVKLTGPLKTPVPGGR